MHSTKLNISLDYYNQHDIRAGNRVIDLVTKFLYHNGAAYCALWRYQPQRLYSDFQAWALVQGVTASLPMRYSVQWLTIYAHYYAEWRERGEIIRAKMGIDAAEYRSLLGYTSPSTMRYSKHLLARVQLFCRLYEYFEQRSTVKKKLKK